MKRTFLILLIGLLVASCGSEGAETPELAATRFLEALQSGDADDVYAAVVRTEADSFRKTDERLNFNRWDDSNIEDFEIKGKELDGNRYRVTVLVTREIDGKEQAGEEIVVCVEEHKRWKVSISSSSKSFVPSGKRPD
ncbi:MAG: DUF4878 domain-containing protein [Planctomycetes bacterium]|nr:DUF4878 domain-containing protein [Planctomycetota bacterium]